MSLNWAVCGGGGENFLWLVLIKKIPVLFPVVLNPEREKGIREKLSPETRQILSAEPAGILRFYTTEERKYRSQWSLHFLEITAYL